MSTVTTATMTRLPDKSLMSEREDFQPSSGVLLPPSQSTAPPSSSPSPQSPRRYCCHFQQRSTRPWWCGGGGWLVLVVLLLLTGATGADRLDSLASVLREVTGQLERFNTLYISKLERELSSSSARLAALEATVRAISDRADAWDNIQNHMTVWTDQTRTMDRKLDLLNRCHEKLDAWEVKLNAVDGLTHKLTALDTKINTMTRLEFQVEQVSERVEEVDSKVTWLQKQMETPEKKPQTQAPIITEFAGRGVLSSLVTIEKKLENLSKVVGESPPVAPVKRPRVGRRRRQEVLRRGPLFSRQVMGARFRSLKSTVEPEPGILFTQGHDDRVTLCQLHPNDARRIEDVRAKVDLVFDRVTDPDYDYDYFANDLRRPAALTAPTGTNSASGGSGLGGGGGSADFDVNNPEQVFARFWKSLFAPFKKFNRRFRSIESQLDVVQKVCNMSTDDLEVNRNFGIMVERKLKPVDQGLQRRLQEIMEFIVSQGFSLGNITQSVGNVAYLSEHALGEMGQLFQAQNDFMREKFSKTREDIFKYCSRGDDDGIMTRRDEDPYIPIPPPPPTHPTRPSATTTTTTTTTPATVPKITPSTRRTTTTTTTTTTATAYKPPIVPTSATTPKRRPRLRNKISKKKPHCIPSSSYFKSKISDDILFSSHLKPCPEQPPDLKGQRPKFPSSSSSSSPFSSSSAASSSSSTSSSSTTKYTYSKRYRYDRGPNARLYKSHRNKNRPPSPRHHHHHHRQDRRGRGGGGGGGGVGGGGAGGATAAADLDSRSSSSITSRYGRRWRRSLDPGRPYHHLHLHNTITTTSSTTSLPQRQSWLDCSDLMADGIKRSGVFELGPLEEVNDAGRNYYTRYCDMETAGGGWTVIQRRGAEGGHLNFTRDWNAYKNGFGDQKGEFWWGNEFIYRLTNAQDMVIRFDLWDFEGNYTFAEYRSFRLSSESDKYRLSVSDYRGNASDSFSAHNGYLFSTWDKDNDEAPECCPCAPAYGGGWWFYSCFESNLNGEYHMHPMDNDYYRGIIWELWLGDYSLKATEMKLRPADVSSVSSGGSSFPTPYPGPFPLDPFAPEDP